MTKSQQIISSKVFPPRVSHIHSASSCNLIISSTKIHSKSAARRNCALSSFSSRPSSTKSSSTSSTKKKVSSVSSSISSIALLLMINLLAATTMAHGGRNMFYGVFKRGGGGGGGGGECHLRNRAVGSVFDKICDMCYEMYQVEEPNLKIECRANCFDNDKFKRCLQQYAPSGMNAPPVRRSQRPRWSF